MKITSSFATPIVTCLHENPGGMNSELAKYLLSMEAAANGRPGRVPSMKLYKDVYETDFYLFDKPEPCVQELKEFCWNNLRNLVQALNGYSEQEKERLEITAHSWAHITRNFGYFGSHNHPMVSWSGVYCVSPGEPNPDYPDSGVLQFHNPLLPAAVYEDAGNTRLSRPYGFKNINYYLQPGLLILFPSWAVHEVLPYMGASPRITIAFNCKVDLAQ